MHPPDCPKWEDAHHPDRATVLPRRAAEVLLRLRSGDIDTAAAAVDTRPVHGRLFLDLTPACCPYYAGHYRGESYRCLEHLSVGIRDDPAVGCPPSLVARWMTELGQAIDDGLAALDAPSPSEAADKVLLAVAIGCRAFEYLLRIHPYANGNGHAARFLLVAILGRYGYWLRRWPLEPRPPDPPYTTLIRRYRGGDPRALESYVLSLLED